MSHSKERKEKICLNCGAAIYGRYCHVCGQENIEPKESFWHLLTHFVYDITHFDGKFFSTLSHLLFRPGFLSKEYMKGRRASYLNPIKMYVFTSAFFFLIFFSFYSINDTEKYPLKENLSVADAIKQLSSKKEKHIEKIRKNPAWENRLQPKISLIDTAIRILQLDSTKKDSLMTLNYDTASFRVSSGSYTTVKAYDSVQALLNEEKRDNFIERFLIKLVLEKKAKYGNKGMASSLVNALIHQFPKMLFVSLPLFALLLQLLYARRKSFYYMSHVIFTLHLYCGTFIIMLLDLWAGSIFSWFNSETPTLIELGFFLWNLLFSYKSFRNFYEQKRGKTIFKFFILLFLSVILFAFLFIIFFMFSFISI